MFILRDYTRNDTTVYTYCIEQHTSYRLLVWNMSCLLIYIFALPIFQILSIECYIVVYGLQFINNYNEINYSPTDFLTHLALVKGNKVSLGVDD